MIHASECVNAGRWTSAGPGQAVNTKRRSRRDRADRYACRRLAKLVGVSSSTVSGVVNNSIPVSAELRQAIEPSSAGTWTA